MRLNPGDKNRVGSDAAPHDKLGRLDGHHIQQIKIIVEKHPDGYVAYPLGVRGVVVGEGETYEAAVADVKSAIKFHVETFGPGVLEIQPRCLKPSLLRLLSRSNAEIPSRRAKAEGDSGFRSPGLECRPRARAYSNGEAES